MSGSKVSVRFPAALNRTGAAFIDMTFVAASGRVMLPGERLPGCVNDLAGTDPRLWRRDVPAFSSLRVPGLYRGIDVLYRGVATGIEYDFLVSPGANPRQIRIQFRGAEHVLIQEDGGLIASGPGGEVRQSKPVAYQEWAGARRAIQAGYVWRNGAIGIRTGRYDRSRPLVIDPVVVVYTGVFGGHGGDEGDAITADASGAVYIAGYTNSYDFPLTPGAANNSPNTNGASFVTKLNANDGSIVYSTFLNGKASGIAVDRSGSAYVIASTYVGFHDGLAEGIQVTKLSPSGDSILYQTSLPGPGLGRGIAVDGPGSVYITGSTAATNFPVTAGTVQTELHGKDAFVAKLDTAGRVVYATYLGGGGDEEGRAIAADGAGNAYVTGVAHNSTDFPVVNAAQPAAGGAFVYRSDDGGATWTPAGKGITSAVAFLAVDPSNGSVAYAALNTGGLVKTTDGGANWIAAGNGLGTQGVSSLAIDANHSFTLYAADGVTLYRSTDGGNTWRDVGAGTPLTQNPLGGPTLVVVDTLNKGVIYAARGWLAKSTDSGNTWVALTAPGYPESIQQLALDTVSSAIYASGYPFGLKKSTDGGVTWKSIAGSDYFALSRSGTLYVNGSLNISRSDDGGASWQAIGSAAPGYAPALPLAADPTNSDVIYSWAGSGYWSGGSFIPGELYQHSGTSNLWQMLSQTLSGESAITSGNINYITAFAAAPSTPNRLYYAASPGWDAFVAKINPTGTKLLYATYLGGISNDYGNAIAVDANGNAYVAGSTASIDFPATAASFQRAFGGGSPFRDARLPADIDIIDYPRGTDAFVAKLDASGSRLVYASYLGGSGVDWALGLAIDPNGSALVTGYTGCSTFPSIADSFIPPHSFQWSAFVSQITPDGSHLSYSTCFGGTGGVVASGIALDSQARAFLTGLAASGMVLTPGAGSVGSALFTEVQFPGTVLPVISRGGIVDALTYDPDRASPGTVISIFGTGLASIEARAQSVPLPTSLGGVSATIDGIAAPMFYASPGQINLQVPWEVKPGVSQVVVTNATGSSAPASLPVHATGPAIATYPGTSRAIAINQDQTLNSASNPAPAKSIITLYLIGQGPVSNTPATGGPSPFSPLARASSSASVSVGPSSSTNFPYSADLQYLGLTPGMVGLAQANVRLPDMPAGDYRLMLTVADVRSNIVIVTVGAR